MLNFDNQNVFAESIHDAIELDIPTELKMDIMEAALKRTRKHLEALYERVCEYVESNPLPQLVTAISIALGAVEPTAT